MILSPQRQLRWLLFKRRTIVVGLSNFSVFYSLNRLNFEFGIETMPMWPIFPVWRAARQLPRAHRKVVHFFSLKWWNCAHGVTIWHCDIISAILLWMHFETKFGSWHHHSNGSYRWVRNQPGGRWHMPEFKNSLSLPHFDATRSEFSSKSHRNCIWFQF